MYICIKWRGDVLGGFSQKQLVTLSSKLIREKTCGSFGGSFASFFKGICHSRV
jgi:hypothetical protein